MPTYPTIVTPGATGEMWKGQLTNLGITPLSSGPGELEAGIANAASGASRLARLAPQNVIGETLNRTQVLNGTIALSASGTLQMMGCWLLAGQVISNINIMSGSTGSTTMTNQWAAIFSRALVMQAISADATTATLTANTMNVYPIATIVTGASTTWTVPNSGWYYIGFGQAFTSTAPTLAGPTVTTSATAVAMSTLPTVIAGASTTSVTGPFTFPTTATALTASAAYFYANLT